MVMNSDDLRTALMQIEDAMTTQLHPDSSALCFKYGYGSPFHLQR